MSVPLALVPVTVVVMLVAGSLPMPTTVGVDGRPTVRTISLLEKAVGFWHRDIAMRSLAERIGSGAAGDEALALRVLEWTRANVRPVPPGLPVVDDHAYHVVVRGYGTHDQAADVFAILAAYAGLPATLALVRSEDGALLYSFALVRLNGDWRVVDVREGIVLRRKDGTLASLDELRADPTIAADLPRPRGSIAGYPTLLARLERPERLRSETQMPLSRAVLELRRLVGLDR